MATNKYEVIIHDPVNDVIWEVIPKSYGFTEVLNKESVGTFYFSYEELKKMAEINDTTVLNIFTAAYREIYINRNGTKIFYGYIDDFAVEPVDGGDMTVTVRALSFFALFKKALVGIGTEVRYEGVDAGDIAWDLINDWQLADAPYSSRGITEGSITASKNRIRGYLFDNIYEEIVRLSNENLVDGFDFEIDSTKAFNVYYPTKGQSRPNIVFDDRTAASWRYKKSLISSMVNQVHVLGEGVNDDINYATRTAATSYRTPFGTLEEKLDARNTTEAATLQDKGDRRLLEAREPEIELTGVAHYDDGIAYTDYNVGDTIIINFPQLGIINDTIRVKERSFTMQTPQSIGLVAIKIK